MKNSIALSIPKPCHEKWENFNPTPVGGFCSGCRKEVIDFTTWDDDKIKNYFKNPSIDSTCGRFRSQQLKIYAIDPLQNRRIPKFLSASLLSISMLLMTRNAEAQISEKPSQEMASKHGGIKTRQDSESKIPATKKIKGIVYEGTSNTSPMPGVNVILKGTSQATSTDGNGRFELLIKNPKPNDTLVYSFIGCITIEQNVFASDYFEIHLEEDTTANEPIVTGGITAHRNFSPRGIWWRFKNLFR